MRPVRVVRADAARAVMRGLLVAHDVRDASGRTVVGKGTILDDEAIDRLDGVAWDELHLVAADAGELHEEVAGGRLAAAAAGDCVAAGSLKGGHWPLTAMCRGLLEVRRSALRDVNTLQGLAVYSLFDGQVVDAGESVGRAKIVPFLIAAELLERAEAIARAAHGLMMVRPFAPTTIGVVVQESLGDRARSRFREAIGDKVAWFGSRLLEPRLVGPDATAIAAAMDQLIGEGASVLVLAGSRPMDPLDPSFGALAKMGARIERHGVPAHPGSLLWLARSGEIPVVGMPSCGLFSQATVFDLVLPRLLAGERVDAEWLAGLGHGGFLTRDMAFRFPAYRPARERGEVE